MPDTDNKKSEDIWPPQLPVENADVFQEKAYARWSTFDILAGIDVGFLLFLLVYVTSTAFSVGAGIYLAMHPSIPTMFYHLVSGLTSVLDVLSLVGPIVLFWRFRKSRIAYAIGIVIGGVLAMVVVMHINHLLVHNSILG